MSNNLLIQIKENELKTLIRSALSDYFNENPQTNSEEPKPLTIAEAANYLNCAIPTIYAKVSKREIPFHKQGKRLYFNKVELMKWIEAK